MPTRLLAALSTSLVATLTASTEAQVVLSWGKKTPATHPALREGHALAYDESRKRTVLFGGQVGSTLSAETWEWDGQAWTQMKPLRSPPGRMDHAMAYDSVRRRVVLFGGSGSRFTKTWLWDGKDWTEATPSRSPSARSHHAMTFDSKRQRVVLFGGSVFGGLGDDVWEWDGKTWTLAKSTTPSPAARWGHALAFDEARGQTVLFGGRVRSGTTTKAMADIWFWNGSSWTFNPLVRVSPSPRSEHALAWDSVRSRVILFGGALGAGGWASDTWEWTGSLWSQLKPIGVPSVSWSPAIAFDRARRVAVLVGSFPPRMETWELASDAKLAGTFGAYGSGCGGSPVATLAAAAGNRPTIGKPFSMITSNMASTTSSALMLMGLSNTQLGPYQLPLPLDQFGMKGCLLHTSTEVIWAIPIRNGTGVFSFVVPNSNGLVGQRFYFQAASNKVSTNGGELRVGNL